MWIGLVVSAACAYLALRDVDFAALRTALGRSDHWALVPAGAILALAVLLRAIRWQVLFAPGRRPPIRIVTSALLIGYFFNTTLPARAGEAARVVALNQRAGTSRFEALGTVVAERVLDVLALLALLFVTAPFLPHADWLARTLELGAVVFALLIVAGVLFAVYGGRPARVLLRPLAALPGISRTHTDTGAANLIRGLSFFRRAAVAVPACALTFASWLLVALSSWLVLRGFDLELGFQAGLLVVVATNLALIIPSGPAAIGVFEAATVAALAAFSVDRTTAVSYGILLHALNAVPFVVVGYAALQLHAAAVRRGGRRQASRVEATAEGRASTG
jgi:uncharacterized protein (TIRG00374 family)